MQTMIDYDILEMIKEEANERIEDILLFFGVQENCTFYTPEIRTSCFIHMGDNQSSWCYDKNKRYWACYSRNCHLDYKSDIFGLVRALSEKNNNQKMSFRQSVQWIKNFLGMQIDENIPYDVDKLEVNKYISERKSIRNLKTSKSQSSNKKSYFKPIPLSYLINSITPSKYFSNQFSQETLKKFYISDCNNPNKRLFNRACCLVLNDTGDIVTGVSGRIMMDQCELCGCFHNTGNGCPIDNPKIKTYHKWFHWGFSRDSTLYNYCNAQQYIKETRSCIICEGPKDVWWLDQNGIYNSMAIFGTKLGQEHIKKLIQLGVQNLIIALDNDEAGQKSFDRQKDILEKYFTIKNISPLIPEGKDVADLTKAQLMEIFHLE